MFDFNKNWNIKGILIILFISIFVSLTLFLTPKLNSVGEEYLIFKGVRYYVDFKELYKDIEKSKQLDEYNSITSSIINKNNTNYKYDIFNEKGKKIIIFYKFENEDDPLAKDFKINIEQLEKMIKK